ncbi:MAG: hypothetical protein AAF621_08130, partial [Pseudomonadota bacterium]
QASLELTIRTGNRISYQHVLKSVLDAIIEIEDYDHLYDFVNAPIRLIEDENTALRLAAARYKMLTKIFDLMPEDHDLVTTMTSYMKTKHASICDRSPHNSNFRLRSISEIPSSGRNAHIEDIFKELPKDSKSGISVQCRTTASDFFRSEMIQECSNPKSFLCI